MVDKHFDVGIEDETNNHRLYYVTTKDFETFSEPKLLYEPGFSCIDAVLVKRGAEDYVMVLKDNTRPNRNLKIAFAKDAEGPYTPPSEAFTETFVEGPSVEKVGEDYYIYFDVYAKKIYGAMKTRDFIHFTDAALNHPVFAFAPEPEVDAGAGRNHGQERRRRAGQLQLLPAAGGRDIHIIEPAEAKPDMDEQRRLDKGLRSGVPPRMDNFELHDSNFIIMMPYL